MEEKKESLFWEVLKLTRLRLQEKLPFLDAAIALPSWKKTDKKIGTDGVNLYWNVNSCLQIFRDSPENLQRVYLHMTFHGLYLHSFRKGSHSSKIWNLACDILTEYRIDRMHISGFIWPIPHKRSQIYRKLKEEKVLFSETCLSAWLVKQDKSLLEEWSKLFHVDEHDYWQLTESILVQSGQSKIRKASLKEMKTFSEAVHRWREVFEQLDLRVEEHKKQAGGSAGSQTEQIVLEKEKGHDYRKFLKKFAVSQEELCLDMDSFDYIPYHYSRQFYDNLVFLEPLEYKEMQKLQEFVIAIDTSGSCSGEIVKQFLEETWEIFCEKENFFKNMNIHIIQCDCLIQEHIQIRSEEEWKDYLSYITVKGHGDTDFTPVFRLVERLIEEGAFKNLKGLLYFTDGDGIYPSKAPAYETAFVYLNEGLRKGKAPDWAWTLTLDREVDI